MTTFATTASDWTIRSQAALDLEVVSGGLRLRPRPSYNTTNRAALIMDCNQAQAGFSDSTGAFRYKDLVNHLCGNTYAILNYPTGKRFSGDVSCAKSSTASAGIEFAAKELIDLSADEWTLDIEASVSTTAGIIASLRGSPTKETTTTRFILYWAGSAAKRLDLTMYGGGSSQAISLSLSTWTFPSVAGQLKPLDLRVAYSKSSDIFIVEARNADLSDAKYNEHLSNSQSAVIDLNDDAGYNSSGLQFLSQVTESAVLGVYNQSGPQYSVIQRAVYYLSYLGTGLTDITARPTFYATSTGADDDGVSALITLDSGQAAATWDFSSLDASDTSVFAATVGAGDGYELVYQVSESSAPDSWSAWKTWAQIKALSDEAGRYLHLGLVGKSNGYDDYYPLSWISCDATIYSTPGTPTLTSAENDETGTSATLTLTPPATGDYDQCRIYYRVYGYGETSWTSGGTYVGVQGTSGTKQITGLTAERYYDFYVVAESGTVQGSPSAVQRCWVGAQSPLVHAIKANAVAALQTISTDNGYNQTVDSDAVFDHRPMTPNPPKYPAIYCWWEETVNSNDILVGRQVKAGTLMVGIKTAVNDDPELGLDRLVSDVEKALMADRYRGGYAIDTILEDGDPDWRPPGQDPTGACYLTFKIVYRHLFGNPYSQ